MLRPAPTPCPQKVPVLPSQSLRQATEQLAWEEVQRVSWALGGAGGQRGRGFGGEPGGGPGPGWHGGACRPGPPSAGPRALSKDPEQSRGQWAAACPASPVSGRASTGLVSGVTETFPTLRTWRCQAWLIRSRHVRPFTSDFQCLLEDHVYMTSMCAHTRVCAGMHTGFMCICVRVCAFPV